MVERSVPRSLVSDTVAFALSGGLVKAASFILIPVYTTFLTPEDYGTADLVQLFIQIAVPITTCSISEGVLRFAIRLPDDIHSIAGVGWRLTMAGSILGLLVGVGVAIWLRSATFGALAYLLFIGQAWSTLLASLLKAAGWVKRLSVVAFISGVVTLLANVVLVAGFEIGITGFWCGMVLGSFTGVGGYLASGGASLLRLDEPLDRQLVREMVRYAAPLMPNALFWWVNSASDRLAVAWLVSVSAAGLFTAALKVPQILSTLSGYFFQALNLAVFRESETEAFARFCRRSWLLLCAAVFLTSSVLIACEPIYERFLYGDSFADAVRLIGPLIVGTGVSLFNQLLGSMLLARRRSRIVLLSSASGTLVNVCTVIVFVHIWGVMGAPIATCLSYLVVFVLRSWALHRLGLVTLRLVVLWLAGFIGVGLESVLMVITL